EEGGGGARGGRKGLDPPGRRGATAGKRTGRLAGQSRRSAIPTAKRRLGAGDRLARRPESLARLEPKKTARPRICPAPAGGPRPPGCPRCHLGGLARRRLGG